MTFRDLPGRAVRGPAFSEEIKPYVPAGFIVVDPGSGKRAVLVVPSGEPPLRAWASRVERARALLALQPVQRSRITDAAELMVETVRARSDVILEVIDENRVDSPGVADANLIHLGVNEVVRSLLRPHWRWVRAELLARVSVPSATGVFSPERAPDSDGFVMLALRDPVRPRSHLILLGGTGWGTRFAVVHLLSRHAGARWLAPGPGGAVVPRSPSWILARDVADDGLNVYDEPDYRGRSLDALSAPVQSLAAIDAVRDWALNNRLHPADERIYLFEKPVEGAPRPSPLCATPIAWPTRVFVRKETRIPVPHALHDLLSPYEFDPVQSDRRRFEVHPEFYPDIRPRVSLQGAAPITRGAASTMLPLPPELGRPLPTDRLNPTFAEIGTEEGCAQGGYEALPREVPRRLVDLSATNLATPQIPEAEFSELTGNGRPYAPAVMRPRVQHFGRIEGGRRDGTVRFIPLSRRQTVLQEHQPASTDWKFCIYAIDAIPAGAPGRLAPVRGDMAEQLASACVGQISALRTAPEGEVVLSLLPNDGGGWCQCDACALSVSESNGAVGGQVLQAAGAPSQWRMHKGVTLFAAEQTEPSAGATVLATRRTNFAYLNPMTLEGVATRFEVPSALRESFWRSELTPDELAAQGLLRTGRQSDVFSRRYVDLVNALVARVVVPAGPEPVEVWFSIAAYSDWRGAPIMASNAQEALKQETTRLDDETSLRGNVIVFVTGVRDLPEYQPTMRWAGSALRDWHAMSERFNFARWSLLAPVTGVYEYLLDGQWYLAPRLYSSRLGAALIFSHRCRARAFVGEASPAWALDGPKWVELAARLWNVGDTPEAQWAAAVDPARSQDLRTDYCRSVCTAIEGAESPPPNAGLVQRLETFFDAVESAWCELLDRSLEGYQGSWELGLSTLTRRLGQLDVIDPPGLGGFSGPIALVAEIDAIYRDAQAISASVASRVGFLRAGWQVLDAVARVTRGVRYLRRYVGVRVVSETRLDVNAGQTTTRTIDPAFVPSWTVASRVAPPEPSRALLREALTQLNGWFASPTAFMEQVRAPVNTRLVTVGLLSQQGGAISWRQGDESSVAETQFLLDPRGVSQYVARWNGDPATRFNLENPESLDRAGGLLGTLIGDLKSEALRIAGAARNFNPMDTSDPFHGLIDVNWVLSLREDPDTISEFRDGR